MDSEGIKPTLRFVARNFVRGVAITLPVVLTVYVAWQAVSWVDGWLGLAIPGVGLLVVMTIVTIVGALATNVVTRAALATLDQIFERLPLFRLLYTAAKDLMGAFVGNKRRFNKAVRVQPDPKLDLWFLGFVTADDVTRLGLTGHVAVYLPQSYNIAGNLVLVPADRVVPIEGDSSEVMSFIVSGGVTGGTAVSDDRGPRTEDR